MLAFRSRFALVLVMTALFSACDPVEAPGDAGPPDTGPAVPTSTDHCDFVPLTATAHSGTPVTSGTVHAGVAELRLGVPLGVTLGGYASRSPVLGGAGFIDDRRPEIAGEFASSIGIQDAPMVRALAISTGTAPDYDETVLIMKLEVPLMYQGLLFGLEERLGPEYAGHIIIGTNHSHAGYANFIVDAIQIGFGPFRRTVYDQIVDDLEEVARAALANRRPAAIGVGYDPAFDMDDRVTRDRRGENDELPHGREDDHHLYVIRVDDAADGSPMAVVPVFGVHGTILNDGTMFASADAPGGIDRAIAEMFDESPSGPVMVMHLQGAGGNVSPAGLEVDVACPPIEDDEETPLCDRFMRIESVGRRAGAAVMAAWEAAGEDMETELEVEMVTRSIELGPDWETFTVRDGALRYAPFDGVRPCDGDIWDDSGGVISPIDEFNAPNGAGLCASDGMIRAFNPRAQLPGTLNRTSGPITDEVGRSPYMTCNRLEGVELLFESALAIELTGPPLCETTRTILTALRLGDWHIATLPGEPVVTLVERLREISPVPADHLITVGYAQDHQGYLLPADDWLTGGYEPTITFWGPLQGELIVERAADLLDVLTTPERENAAEGTSRVAVPSPTESFVPDAAPMAGTIPATAPAYVVNRLLPLVPANADVPATAHRLESVFFTWIGADPLTGTPVVSIEHFDGTDWVPLTRRSGRVVHDGEILLTWTPDPLVTIGGDGAQTHYWTAEWQVVPGMGPDLRDRFAAPLGQYRFVVTHDDYTVTSGELEVLPAPLVVTGTLAGADATLHVAVDSGLGFRLLDDTIGSTGMMPIRETGVTALVTLAGGATETRTGLTTTAAGDVVVTGVTGATSIEITDAAGNVGSVTF